MVAFECKYCIDFTRKCICKMYILSWLVEEWWNNAPPHMSTTNRFPQKRRKGNSHQTRTASSCTSSSSPEFHWLWEHPDRAIARQRSSPNSWRMNSGHHNHRHQENNGEDDGHQERVPNRIIYGTTTFGRKKNTFVPRRWLYIPWIYLSAQCKYTLWWFNLIV